jgi:hypothetical protein
MIIHEAFTARFTGSLSTLTQWRFRPGFRIEQGRAYRLTINTKTGAAHLEQIPEEIPDAAHTAPDSE